MTNSISQVYSDQIVTHTSGLMLEIARTLVDKPNEVDLEVAVIGEEVSIRLKVAPMDRLRVIGTHGIILLAIRAILATVNAKTRYRFTLEVEETRHT